MDFKPPKVGQCCGYPEFESVCVISGEFVGSAGLKHGQAAASSALANSGSAKVCFDERSCGCVHLPKGDPLMI
jgi:hypothetical protein